MVELQEAVVASGGALPFLGTTTYVRGVEAGAAFAGAAANVAGAEAEAVFAGVDEAIAADCAAIMVVVAIAAAAIAIDASFRITWNRSPSYVEKLLVGVDPSPAMLPASMRSCQMMLPTQLNIPR